MKAKKRYLLGQNLPDRDGVLHGHTVVTAGAQGDMDFWIPKGANRFHFTGGARFIHGGAMPQEICVPVITVRHIKGKSVEETKTKRVTVHVLGVNHRVTTSRHRFELIQMEPVSDRVKPITLKVAIYQDEEPVTSIESVTIAQQAESALQEAADKVAEEARRTGGTVVVWQHGVVVEIPADQLPPTLTPAE